MADISSWLPGLVGPVEIQQDGETVVAPAETWNFVGPELTFDGVTKVLTIDASAIAIPLEEITPNPPAGPFGPAVAIYLLDPIGNSTIAVDSSAASLASVTLTLSDEEASGTHKWIVDISGNAATKKITIVPGTGQIQQSDGTMGATLDIDTDGGAVHIIKVGASWYTL